MDELGKGGKVLEEAESRRRPRGEREEGTYLKEKGNVIDNKRSKEKTEREKRKISEKTKKVEGRERDICKK